MTTTTLTRQKSKRTLKSFFPIVTWLPKYKASLLQPDTIAALTVWALLVPEAMAYAGIAGMPPEYGLYAAPLALLGYAIFGTSKHMNVGPSSTVAALSFSTIAGLGVASGTDEWIALTAALAIMTGVFLVIGGLLRLVCWPTSSPGRCSTASSSVWPSPSPSANWTRCWATKSGRRWISSPISC